MLYLASCQIFWERSHCIEQCPMLKRFIRSSIMKVREVPRRNLDETEEFKEYIETLAENNLS